MAWTDELKAQVIERYTEAEPTPESSMEIVKEIAEDIEQSPNGVRMILSKAGVYVAKNPTAAKTPASGEKKASTRVSKEDSQARLSEAIAAFGQEADQDIISKMTGKAAVFFAEIFEKIKEDA